MKALLILMLLSYNGDIRVEQIEMPDMATCEAAAIQIRGQMIVSRVQVHTACV